MDSQCGAGGKCSDGFCSFPDDGCPSGFRFGELSGPQSGQCVGAAPIDGGVDTGDVGDTNNMVCYGTGLVMACFPGPVSGTQTFSQTAALNTDTSTLCAATLNNVPACVIAADTITVNTGIVIGATGSRPLVLVAAQTILISGTLAVASSRALTFVGAGADMPGCNAGTAPTGTSGGAGGSFGDVGGRGAAVGTAGMPGAALALTTLRGGCSGQTGADNMGPMGAGGRGRGGGAMYLIAETSILVAGQLNASGGGGGGGATGASAGAGGGGSGGLIGLDSPMVMNTGSIYANGGGGGEASGAQSTGNAGSDVLNAVTAAAGGAGGSAFGTDGGDGSVGTQLTGDPGAPNCIAPCTVPPSGGGGGGGAGIIKRYRATTIPGIVSPPAT
jgi:hypothetical protein